MAGLRDGPPGSLSLELKPVTARADLLSLSKRYVPALV